MIYNNLSQIRSFFTVTGAIVGKGYVFIMNPYILLIDPMIN